MHFLENETRRAIEIRNRENEVNRGMESSFHYPSKKKYAMFTYFMRS